MPSSYDGKFEEKYTRNAAKKSRQRKRRKISGQNLSDSSDEDYVVDQDWHDDEEDEEDMVPSDELIDSQDEVESISTSDDSDKSEFDALWKNKSFKASLRRRIPETTNQDKRPRKNPRNKVRKRTNMSSRDDEDYDYEPGFSCSTTEDDDYEEEQECFITLKSERNSRKSSRRTKISSSDDEDYDYEPGLSCSTPEDEDYHDEEENSMLQNSWQKSRQSRKGKKSLLPKIEIQKENASVGRTTIRKRRNQGSSVFISASKRRRTAFSSVRLKKQHRRRNESHDSHFKEITKNRSRKKIKFTSGSDPDYICSDSDEVFSGSETDASSSASENLIPEDTEILSESEYIVSSAAEESMDTLSRSEKVLDKRKEKGEPGKASSSAEVSLTVCGICLSDDGKAIRGKLDSCSHYFCFACIIEWAKIESKCPMCKQRFSTITKSSRYLTSGKGIRRTIIKIPVRDQMYEPSEEDVMSMLDPYANVACVVCNESGDDDLLLLCDLCDSAHHTFCVGLGRTVPEGDWYCQACQMSVPAELFSPERGVDVVLDIDNASEGAYRESTVASSQRPETANFDLNLPPCLADTMVDRPSSVRMIRRALQRNLSSPSQSLLLADNTLPRPLEAASYRPALSNVTARTLLGQRRLQEHVYNFHDSWSGEAGRASQLLHFSRRMNNSPRLQFNASNSLHAAEYYAESGMVSNHRLADSLHKPDSAQSWVREEDARALENVN